MVAWAALSSTSSDNYSTLSWTFTDCFVDAIQGNPTADLDGDGYISFEELSQVMAREMHFFEDLHAGGDATPEFPKNLPLFAVSRPKAAGEGQFVQVLPPNGEGGIRLGRVVREEGPLCLVRWPGTCNDIRQEWVDSTRFLGPLNFDILGKLSATRKSVSSP